MKVSAGNTKKSQLKDLERYCIYHKDKNKFVIDEVFENPLPKEDKRMSNRKEYDCFNIPIEQEHNIGVYYILKDNDIYIGSTISGFRERFQAHYGGKDKRMQHTYELLQNGGTFHMLYDMTKIEDEPLIRQVENEYIQYFISYTDYNVINKINGWDINNSNKVIYRNIKVQKDNYEQALQLLIDNGLIENTDEKSTTDNTYSDQEFDIDNILF